MTGRIFSTFALMAAVAVFSLVACSETPQPTATSVSFNPTPAGQEPTQPTGSPTVGPDATPTPTAPEGDPQRGAQIFSNSGCSGCHSTGENTLVGPGLGGIYARAETRTSLSADDYLRESIRQPGAYVVDGFANVMPQLPMSDQDVEDLVAYMRTLD